jgi:hypothetical protein
MEHFGWTSSYYPHYFMSHWLWTFISSLHRTWILESQKGYLNNLLNSVIYLLKTYNSRAIFSLCFAHDFKFVLWLPLLSHQTSQEHLLKWVFIWVNDWFRFLTNVCSKRFLPGSLMAVLPKDIPLTSFQWVSYTSHLVWQFCYRTSH